MGYAPALALNAVFVFLCGSQLHTAGEHQCPLLFASVFAMLEKVCEVCNLAGGRGR